MQPETIDQGDILGSRGSRKGSLAVVPVQRGGGLEEEEEEKGTRKVDSDFDFVLSLRSFLPFSPFCSSRTRNE